MDAAIAGPTQHPGEFAMADPQPQTPNETAAGAAREARQSANRSAGQTVEGERRTFESGAETARQVGEAGASATRDLARTAADTSRHLGETGRRAGREVAEAWRSALDPFAAMQMDMTRWFEDLWRQTAGFSPLSTLHAARPFSGVGAATLFGMPPTDVCETEQDYVLAVELPGLAREDVDLTVRGDVLTIRGHKIEEKEHGSASYRISERRFGHFERSFPIPPDVERSRIDASFRNGLLSIKLPKSEQAKQQEAKIQIRG
jgi:HSP20 family protein